MTKALYRKHRSKSLSEIIGQEHITNTLQKSLDSGRISHAYLFIGPRGTGKTSVARILAHAINDFPYELESEHLDILEIDAASHTGVDNIRALREKAIIAPTHGKYKVYIIDEVHMLSRSAFNALLKTLEEPPAHVVFIMATTDAHKVPITITSRSQTFTFKLADPDTMATHLANIAKSENINITTDALQIIARRGGGSFRDSISLLDQISTISTGEITSALLDSALGLPSDQIITTLLSQYSTGDLTSATSTLQSLLDQGLRPELVAEELIARITADPQPPYLPLLEKLLLVNTSSHPPAALLLALLSSAPQTSIPTPVAPAAVATTPPQPTPSTTTKPPTPAKPPTKPTPTPKTTPTPAEPSTPPPTPTPPAPNTPLTTTSAILDQLKKTDFSLHSLLAQATLSLTDDTLTIYHKAKMIRDKIDKKLPTLAALLPGITIKVTDQLTTNDPLIADLSGIFGNVEELGDIAI